MADDYLVLDKNDDLKDFRKCFAFGTEDMIYLDGNSLGRLPLKAVQVAEDVVSQQWGENLIRSWNTDWFGLNERLGAKIARLIGAKENEVLLTDSTSLNLYKLVYGALKFQGLEKNRVVSDAFNFPSDLYIIQGLMEQFGSRHELVLGQSEDQIHMDEDDLDALITEKTALVTLSHVAFKSSFTYNMKSLTQKAQEKGALVLWDLSHSVGALPIHLNDCKVDMAVGCTYKYLNGGPGSIAFLYVREDLQDKLTNPIWAWFADAEPFDFDLKFKQTSGIRRFLTSTTPVLSAATTEPGLDLLLEAGMDQIREKSLALSAYLIDLIKKELYPLGYTLGSPEEGNTRGSHVSIRHPEGYRISQALIAPISDRPIVIPDFRAPDFIRLGLTPLYTSFEDLYRSVHRLKEIVENKEFAQHSVKREKVT